MVHTHTYQLKDRDQQSRFKKKITPTLYFLKVTHFKQNDISRLEVKR